MPKYRLSYKQKVICNTGETWLHTGTNAMMPPLKDVEAEVVSLICWPFVLVKLESGQLATLNEKSISAPTPAKSSTLTPKEQAGLNYTLTNHRNVYEALKDR